MDTTSYSVEGMSCDHCVGSVSSAIEAIEGVETARVDLTTGTVEVRSTGDVTPEQVARAVADAGYELVDGAGRD